MQVGVKDLRDGISAYLRYVREGHEVTVTDHGKPVARLSPVRGESNYEQLVAEGLVQPPQSSERTVPEPLEPEAPGALVSDLVVDQRR